ncbi:hypothetical protein MTP05_01360 [Enterococcus sp. PLM3]|nr:hypothetical protein MTP05_01360 [Enterococcus sp. PLM3]
MIRGKLTTGENVIRLVFSFTYDAILSIFVMCSLSLLTAFSEQNNFLSVLNFLLIMFFTWCI